MCLKIKKKKLRPVTARKIFAKPKQDKNNLNIKKEKRKKIGKNYYFLLTLSKEGKKVKKYLSFNFLLVL